MTAPMDSAAAPDGGRTALASYARTELRGEAVYKGYRPREALLDDVAEALPSAHVLIFSGSWCGDCRREVPKLARIAELLPSGWTFELVGEDEALKRSHHVLAIPTFLVLDAAGGAEIGRIVENPEGTQGIEGHLLAMAQTARV